MFHERNTTAKLARAIFAAVMLSGADRVMVWSALAAHGPLQEESPTEPDFNVPHVVALLKTL